MERQLKRVFLCPANSSGFTLIEMVVAATIFLTTGMAVLSILGGGSSINRNMILEKKAYKAAQSILEKPEYSSGPSYMDLSTGTYNIDVITLFKGRAGSDPVYADRRVIISEKSYSFEGVTIPAKKIISTVSWNDRGKNNVVNLMTIVTYYQ